MKSNVPDKTWGALRDKSIKHPLIQKQFQRLLALLDRTGVLAGKLRNHFVRTRINEHII